MRWLLIFLMVFGGGISSVQASPWPYYSFDITRCLNSDCSSVQYGNAKTYWRDIPDTLRSTVLATQLTIWGVHCGSGAKPGEFTNCEWSRIKGAQHHPDLVNPIRCKTTQDDNWILADTNACEAIPSIFGTHGGASPGAECAVLAKTLNTATIITTPIDTPYGLLTAELVANSRDTYCIKPTAPSLTCNINIPNGGILDHGTQAPNSTSERTLDVEIDCGDNPVITMTDDTVPMDNGQIQSKLSLTPNGPRYLLKSVLTAINATAGSHMGSSVIVVSPL